MCKKVGMKMRAVTMNWSLVSEIWKDDDLDEDSGVEVPGINVW